MKLYKEKEENNSLLFVCAVTTIMRLNVALSKQILALQNEEPSSSRIKELLEEHEMNVSTLLQYSETIDSEEMDQNLVSEWKSLNCQLSPRDATNKQEDEEVAEILSEMKKVRYTA